MPAEHRLKFHSVQKMTFSPKNSPMYPTVQSQAYPCAASFPARLYSTDDTDRELVSHLIHTSAFPQTPL